MPRRSIKDSAYLLCSYFRLAPVYRTFHKGKTPDEDCFVIHTLMKKEPKRPKAKKLKLPEGNQAFLMKNVLDLKKASASCPANSKATSNDPFETLIAKVIRVGIDVFCVISWIWSIFLAIRNRFAVPPVNPQMAD